MLADPLSAVFGALADPTRRAILARLTTGEASVTELAEPFAMSLPAVSKHLKTLERAGLISRGREALKEATEWLDAYRRFWDESLDNLADYLKRVQSPENAPSPEKKR
jgi:DNA-binding transcriptional ArsR family regulator